MLIRWERGSSEIQTGVLSKNWDEAGELAVHDQPIRNFTKPTFTRGRFSEVQGALSKNWDKAAECPKKIKKVLFSCMFSKNIISSGHTLFLLKKNREWR